jgi:hybrid cluster-associated redox disulfide protein
MAQAIRIGDLTIEAILHRWPQTAVVFHRHKMACVGCAVASFCSVADAANFYSLPLDLFLAELAEVIDQTGKATENTGK